MIPNETPQNIVTAGDGIRVVGNFKITDATQARILVSLSDKMYTRKELAFVREYSTNAADAHIVAKLPISKIIVELPTLENLTFRIRDFGSGLTEEQIANVYCVFGESTKRNSAEQNGLLGYGCKAGFAHADSFTVTSWINGEKSIYQCVKGDSQKLHSAILLSRSKSDEPTGIEITIPVKQSSIWTVHREAADFYKHWPEIPTILNMDENQKLLMEKFRNTPATLKGDGWAIRSKSGSNATAVAYMGWVAYSLDWNVLYNRMSLDSRKRVLFDLLQSNDITLSFKMGEVQFVDSREQLEYTDLTLHALTIRIENIFSKIQDSIQEKFDPAPNIWEAKKIYNAIFGSGTIEKDACDGESSEIPEKIKILDGNLQRLEETFVGVFKWNGLPLGNSYFDDINKFDNMSPTKVHDAEYTPQLPVMISYRKKYNRLKTIRCMMTSGNRILASNTSAVVINDTAFKTGCSVAARYLIFKKDSRIINVHILTFSDQTIKDNFYKELGFDSVPLIKLSEIIDDAKKWQSANRIARGYGNSNTNAERLMRYIDLKSGSVHETHVPIREIEDGGYYIETGVGRRGCRKVVGYNNQWACPDNIIDYLKLVVNTLELEIDRIYIVKPATKKLKWFTEAVNTGEWLNVWAYIKENLPSLDVQPLVNSETYSSHSFLSAKLAKKFTIKIKNENSPMLKILAVATPPNQDENETLIGALKYLNLWYEVSNNVQCSVDFKSLTEMMETQYPLINYSSMEHSLNNEKSFNNIIKYINAMDVYVELCDAKPVEAEAELKTA